MRKKIAVIGSGISGLTSAHLLAPHHEVTLFEKSSRLGGHTHTVDVEVASGRYAVDTGFIVCNDRNYPNFLRLIDGLGLKLKRSSMSFGVRVEEKDLEYNGTSLNALFCQRRNFLNPSFYRMIFDILRFNREATRHYLETKDDQDESVTLESYLRENGYSEEFLETYIMPMGAAIWSCSREEMRRFPLAFFVRFFHHHGLLTIDERPQWYVLEEGSRSYLEPISKNFKDRIRLASSVSALRRLEHGVELTVNGNVETFDEVICAAHADETLLLLSDASEVEREVLGGFEYRPNDIILHTDTSILPKKPLAHASWNYFLPRAHLERVAVTYHMNILQGISAPETFLVSLNMKDYIDPATILKKVEYAHPVYSYSAMKSQARWEEISGASRVHFCGAYWGNGFHEDGVKSALRVAQSFGVDLC